MDDPDWRDLALCAETDPEIFFPEKGGSTKEAKLVCRRCPVRAECLEYALQIGDRFGIYGGLSPQERRRLRRPAPAAAVVTEKTCTACGITKPLDEFHRNLHNSTGRAERCKACRHEISRQRWQEKAA